MKTAIFNREQIESLSLSKFDPCTALISITDSGWTYAELKNKPDFLLQIAFDDVDNDVFEDELGRQATDKERELIETKYHMLTDTQAVELAEFILFVKDRANLLICQCEHGQSRSAAVAASILEYIDKSGIEIFADDNYYPNKMVFKKVLGQLKKIGG